MGDEQAEPAAADGHLWATAWADQAQQLRSDVVGAALYWYDLRHRPATTPAERDFQQQQLAFSDQRLTEAVAAYRDLGPPPGGPDQDTTATIEKQS